METVVIKAAQLILSLSILVIVHELGHFLFARIFKVRVEKFYLFFNPWFTLFKFKPKGSETEYGIGWLPLGGYVKISGMIDESMDKEALKQAPQPWEFRTKPAWQRLLIMVGGVGMNFILAFFIYAMIVLAYGDKYVPMRNVTMGFSFNQTALDAGFQNGDIPLYADGVALERLDTKTLFAIADAKEVQVLRNGEKLSLTLPKDFRNIVHEKDFLLDYRIPFVIERVTNGSPAQAAGLMEGDRVLGVNGQTDMDVRDIQQAMIAAQGGELLLNVLRSGKELEITVTPSESGKLGVGLMSPLNIYETVNKKYNFFTAFPAGIRIGIQTIKDYLGQFKFIFSKEGAGSLGGFGTIGSFFPAQWDWERFWVMTAFLSIILGIMNLLPIPALDGGHVMFLLYEVITGRTPNEKFMEYAQMGGMIFLISLLLYANGMDIVRAFFQ
jgi:regulator of sigma E protease